MKRRDIRAYLDRDWPLVRRAKEEHRIERLNRLGGAEALRVGDDLRAEAEMLTGSVSGEARTEDLAAHIALVSLLRKAGAA